MLEVWKDVVGYKTLYKVSNLGRVKSLERIHIMNGCVKRRVRKEIMLTPTYDRGYLILGLTTSKGIQKMKKVHRLVLEAFIPNIHNKRTVNHINGIKDDNRLENIEWATDLENTQHGRKAGLFHDEKPINQIKNGVIIDTFKSLSEASRKTNIQISNISYCCSGARKNAGGYQWEYIKKEMIV